MGRAAQGLIGALVLVVGVGLGLRGPELWVALVARPSAGQPEPAADVDARQLDGPGGVEEPAVEEQSVEDLAVEELAVGDADPEEPAAEAPAVATRSTMGPPVGPPPPSLLADLAGAQLVSLRTRTVLEARRVDSAAALERAPRRLAPPAGPVEQLCTDGTVLALAGPTDVELRSLADDHFLERLRPARPRVDRVLCPGSGAVVAVALGKAGVATWWDAEGRELGRLQPPSGIVAVVENGDQIIVLDGDGELRGWDGRRRESRGRLDHAGTPVALAAALGGPPWALFPERACRVGGDCLAALAARGIAAAGEGWLAVAGPDRVQLFDTVVGTLLHELPARPTGLFVAPSGALLVVEPDGVRVIEPATGTERRTVQW